jgi:hypothetical protein
MKGKNLISAGLVLGIVFFMTNKVYAGELYPVYHPKKIFNTPVKNSKISKKTVKKTVPADMTDMKDMKDIKDVKSKLDRLYITPVYVKIKNGEAVVVKLSINAINRIVVNSYIKNIKTSKTGDTSILLQGKNAYVQFTPVIIQRGGVRETKYPTAISSAIFTTKRGIFTLIMEPKSIAPQNIFIKQNGETKRNYGSGAAKISKKGFSKFAASLLTAVYDNRIPDGFIKKRYVKNYPLNYAGIKLVSVKKYEGYNFNIYEFHVINMSSKIISLDNKEFLKVINNPSVISLSNEHIYPEAYSRLFIIARRGE